MKYYGIDMQGPLLLEAVDTLPEWHPNWKRRIVYVLDVDRIYIGTQLGWVDVGVGVVAGSTVTLDTSNFNNNLSVLDNTVQKALETIDELIVTGSSAGATSADTTLFNNILSNADTDVQHALNTLNSHIHSSSVITVNTSQFDKNLTSADNTVQKALDTLDNLDLSVTASDVVVDTDLFDGLLSSADTDLQHALETIDEINAGLIPTDTTNFTEVLSNADDSVQKALETLDAFNGSYNTCRTFITKNINMTSTGQTTLYTVPVGKRFIVDSILILEEINLDVEETSEFATYQLGTTTLGVDFLLSNEELSYNFSTLKFDLTSPQILAGDSIQFGVVTAAGAAQLIVSVMLNGYLLEQSDFI